MGFCSCAGTTGDLSRGSVEATAAKEAAEKNGKRFPQGKAMCARSEVLY
jgi:hypothetical protein